MYIVLGLGCFLVGWRFAPVEPEVIFSIGTVGFTAYDGLFVLGGILILRGLFRWMHSD